MSARPRGNRLDRGDFLPAWPVSTVVPGSWWLVVVAAVLLAIVGAAALGWLVVEQGVFVGLGILVGITGLIAMVSDIRAALWAALAIVTLLPFGVIPFRVGLTLTLLEAASLVVLTVWLVGALLARDKLLPASAPAALITLFLGVTLFAFLLGVGRGYTNQTYHDYAKFILAILLVFVVWTSVTTLADIRRFLNVLLLGGSGAAAIGLVLYALGPGFTEQVLGRLVPLGYPGSRIVRYIEDNPDRAMRLISTSVDPNAAGGLLAVVFVIAAVQLVSRRRLVPDWLCTVAASLTGLALLLTLSRAAWLGAATGLGIAALLRYRWLIPVGLTGLAGLLVFGVGASFVHRLWLGFTLQDPATRLRLAEYRNALEIIREYPLFGVGFGEAPSVELQAGVSSIYLAIAQQTGVLGLVAYLIAVGAIGFSGLRWWRRRAHSVEGDLMLTLLGALGAMLMIGIFDHYFFNIQYSHSAAIFWVICGLILALSWPVQLARRRREPDLTNAHAGPRVSNRGR